jgi:hypothetical protein
MMMLKLSYSSFSLLYCRLYDFLLSSFGRRRRVKSQSHCKGRNLTDLNIFSHSLFFASFSVYSVDAITGVKTDPNAATENGPLRIFIIIKGVVDGWASSDAACQAGGLGLIPGPGQTYV